MLSMPDSIKFKPLSAAARVQINRFIAKYGTAEKVEIRRDGVKLVLRLAGMSRPVDVEIGTFRIAPDGSCVEFGGCASSVPFVAEALNRDFARTVAVNDPKVRALLTVAASLLG